MRRLVHVGVFVIMVTSCTHKPTNDNDGAAGGAQLTVRGGTINRDGVGLGLTISIRSEDADAGESPLVELLPPDAGAQLVAIRLDADGVGWADLEAVAPTDGTWTAVVQDASDGGVRATFEVNARDVLPPPRVTTVSSSGTLQATAEQSRVVSFGCEFLDLDGRSQSWSANCDGLCTTTTPGVYWVRLWVYVPPRVACSGVSDTWSDANPLASYGGALTAVTTASSTNPLHFAMGSLFVGTEMTSTRTVAWLTEAHVDGAADFSFLVSGMREPFTVRPWFQTGWSMVTEEAEPFRPGSYFGILVPRGGAGNATTSSYVTLDNGETPGELAAAVTPHADGSLVLTITPGENTQGYVVQVNGLGEPLPTGVGSSTTVSFPAGTLHVGVTHALVVFASNQPLDKNSIPAAGWRMRRHVVVDVRRPAA